MVTFSCPAAPGASTSTAGLNVISVVCVISLAGFTYPSITDLRGETFFVINAF